MRLSLNSFFTPVMSLAKQNRRSIIVAASLVRCFYCLFTKWQDSGPGGQSREGTSLLCVNPGLAGSSQTWVYTSRPTLTWSIREMLGWHPATPQPLNPLPIPGILFWKWRFSKYSTLNRNISITWRIFNVQKFGLLFRLVESENPDGIQQSVF